MKLHELFDDSADNTGMDTKDIKNYLMDVLLPLYDGGVPFVSIQTVQDALTSLDTGITLSDDYIINILSPQNMPIIKKIDGNKIYFNTQFDPENVTSDDEAAKQQDHFDKLANDQASKELKKQS